MAAICTAALLVTAVAVDPVQPVPLLLPDFYFESGDSIDDHYRLGEAIGRQFAAHIQERMAADFSSFESYLETDAGKEYFQTLLALHRDQTPELLREVEGVAAGSGVPFETLFVLSLSQEFAYKANPHILTRDDQQHCSDVMMCTEARCVGGHNEDGGYQDLPLFTARVRLGAMNFTVLNYVGDLLGGMPALAFNDHGIAFAMNKVTPADVAPTGLGRNYISRMLLGAKSLHDALDIISTRHLAGHNYQIFDFSKRRILNVEAMHNKYSVINVDEPFAHTNTYLTLNASNQRRSSDSENRLHRLQELMPPASAEDILRMLGDQEVSGKPVFKDQVARSKGYKGSGWTLATVLFDLDNKTIKVMRGNPANLEVALDFGVSSATNLMSANLLSV